MHSPSTSDAPLGLPSSRGLTAFEIVWIFLLFFLFAGSLPPDVGEAHYLSKARHYWQPAWCAGDLFLESRDAHVVFNWTLGWLTALVSLPAAAWLGRGVTWLLLAWSWRRLSWAIVPRPLVSLLSAGWFLLLVRHFHLAGEWVVGGVEAKGLAYVLVFLTLEAVARARWRAALLLAGGAGAFHVLVGGWTAIAVAFAWLLAGRDRPRLVALVPAAAGGLVLALPGLAPAIALNWGIPKDIAREAARIYVFERLSHHLVYHQFAPANIVRFQVLVLVWVAMSWLLRRNHVALRRVEWLVAGTVAITLCGIAIDQVLVWRANQLGQTQHELELALAPLLRYYWFRMSDSLVPVGLALAVAAGLARLAERQTAVATLATIAAVALAALNMVDVCYWRAQQRLPPAVLQPRPTDDSWPRSWLSGDLHPPGGGTTARQWYRDWRDVCAWIADHTPPDALFITPREQQTFKWYAGRAEVVNWKDVPQDAASLIEWKRRLAELYPRDREHRRHDLAAFDDRTLVDLARKYQAQFIVIDRTRAAREPGLPLLYPPFREQNPSFEVLRVPSGEMP